MADRSGRAKPDDLQHVAATVPSTARIAWPRTAAAIPQTPPARHPSAAVSRPARRRLPSVSPPRSSTSLGTSSRLDLPPFHRVLESALSIKARRKLIAASTSMPEITSWPRGHASCHAARGPCEYLQAPSNQRHRLRLFGHFARTCRRYPVTKITAQQRDGIIDELWRLILANIGKSSRLIAPGSPPRQQ